MNYLVFTEIILFVVYAFEVYVLDADATNVYLLIAIIYACLKLLLYIFYDKKIRKYLIVSLLLLTGMLAWFFYPMALFFPLCLNQTNIFTIKRRWSISVLSLLWIFALPSDFIMIFLLAFGFTTIIAYMQNQHTNDIERLDRIAEDARKAQMNINEQLETYSQVTENITYQSQLEERNKLSQTLHDELGHTLSGNILRLEAIKLVLDKDKDKSKNMLQEVIDNLRSGMSSIRDILKSSKPEASTVNIANLQIIIDNVKKQSEVNIRLKYNSDINLINQSMWQAIIPNIKEALTNMMKYSNAENCDIEFAKLNKLYKVSVKDDGRGCSVFAKGLGMVGIEERTALIGGKAIFDGSSGFSFTMIFPI